MKGAGEGGSARKVLLLAICMLGFGGLARAEKSTDIADATFEELAQREVVSASKMARQISDSPSAVAIVTAADIRAFGYRTLADVINSMRGLYTTYDHRYQYLGGRGFGQPGDYAGRIMLLIDGYATQDSLFNQAYIDESGLVDLELVERVEYVPGTGSVTYGNNAMLGIINVITRKGSDFNTTQLSSEVASHGSTKQRATFGKRFENGADLLLSASALDVDGQKRYFPAYDSPANNNGYAMNKDSESSQRIFGKFSFEGMLIEGGYVDRKKQVTTNPARATAFNTSFPIRDVNAFLNASYETDLSLSLHSASRLYFGNTSYENSREFSDFSDGEKFGERDFKAQWWGIDQKFVGQWFADHSVVFGFEFRNDYQQSFRWSFFAPDHREARNIQESYSRTTTSFYLTDEYRFNEQWRLNLGVRYDNASDLDGNLSPRLALIYQPDFKTVLKASYSEAFRMPNAYERSYYGSAVMPEYVAAKELVLQHDFTERLRFVGSLYDFKRTKQLIFNNALDDYVAEGTSQTRGLELELEGSWANGVRARTSAAFQHAHDVTGADLVNSPNLLGKFNISAPLPGNAIRAGFEAQYLGSRLTLDRRELGSVTLANLTFSSERKWLGLSAIFSIKNLFDRDYEVVSPFDWPTPGTGATQDSLRMDGRTYWFQLNYDF
jgi:outer membrane receptor protein involved in Fe transport